MDLCRLVNIGGVELVFRGSDKLISERFTFWTKKLNVKRDFNWTDNFIRWNKLIQIGKLRVEKCMLPFGAVSIPRSPIAPIIFINKTKNNSRKELEKTIVHELLHIKFPGMSEKQIRIETSKVLK